MNALTTGYTDDIPRMTSVRGRRIAIWAPYGHPEDDVAGMPKVPNPIPESLPSWLNSLRRPGNAGSFVILGRGQSREPGMATN